MMVGQQNPTIKYAPTSQTEGALLNGHKDWKCIHSVLTLASFFGSGKGDVDRRQASFRGGLQCFCRQAGHLCHIRDSGSETWT